MKRFLVVAAVVALLAFVGVKLFERSGEPIGAPPLSQDAGLSSSGRDLDPTTAAETYDSFEVAAADSDLAATISTATTSQRALRDQQLLSPQHDGWATEAMAEAAMKQLKWLASQIHQPSNVAQLDLHPFVDAECLTDELRPHELRPSFSGAVTTVRETLANGPNASTQYVKRYEGVEGFREAMVRWLGSLPLQDSELHPHFKITGVQAGEVWRTRVLGELTSSDGTTTRQVNLSWDCDWRYQEGDRELPKLTRLAVVDYREADVATVQGQPWFVERTTGVLGDESALAQQLGQGHHYWLQRVERAQRFDTSVRNGLAIGDVNSDGLDDLYLCQPPGLPNRLFVQNNDGTASEVSQSWGVDFLDQTSAALLIDLDNDGDQDLVLGMPVGILLFENTSDESLSRPTPSFQLRKTLTCDYDVQSLSAVDYDSDGRLDLFVCIYRTAQPNANAHFLYRDAIGGGENRLFRNLTPDTDWQFEDVTEACGLSDGGDRYSLAASWEDFDNDGDPDLYVANDFGPNCLYENRDGRFINVAAQAGVVDVGSGMSVSWGDYNRDGFMDLYVGNMFSSAGQRVTTQAAFRADESEEVRQIYRRLAKGNSLFQNQGDGTFRDIGAEAGVELGRWAWSSLFTDLDNDGWEDIFVANGYITTEDTGDL